MHISEDLTYTNKNVNYLPSLDGLRGISILIVVFGHTFYGYKSFFVRLFPGYFGVLIFFVISGYLITTLLLKELNSRGSISLKGFYIRRALRIIPVSYLFVFILFILNRILNLGIVNDSFLSDLLYLKDTPLLKGGEIYGLDNYSRHYWSLSVEEQFYLIFPWIMAVNVNLYKNVVAVLIVILPFAEYLDFHKIGIFRLYSIHVIFSIFRHITPILVGSLTAVLVYEGKIVIERIMNKSSLFNFILIILSSFIISNLQHFISSTLTPLFSAIIIMYLILNVIKPSDSIIFRILNSKILRYIGIYSYSIYIWQELFTFYFPWDKLLGIPNNIFINLTLLSIVSYLSYNYFEKYFLKLKAKFASI